MIDLCLGLFALSAVLGLWPAYDPLLSYPTLAVTLASVIACAALAHGLRSARAVRLWAAVLWGMGLALALYFIAQYAYHLSAEKISAIATLGRLTTFLPNVHGPVFHPNALASMLLAPLCLGAGLWVSASARAGRWIFAVGTVIQLYALVLTVSRGAWTALGLAALIAVALAARWPRRIKTAALGGGALVLIIGFTALLLIGPANIPIIGSRLSLITTRLALYRESLILASDYAFTGLGLGDVFPAVYARYSQFSQVLLIQFHAHNVWLAAWLNQGALGVMALGGLLLAVYWRASRAEQTPVLAAGLMGLTAVVLHGLTDAPQYAGRYATLPVFMAAIGLTIAASRGAPPQKWPRWIWAAPALGLGLCGIFYRPLMAAWHTNLGAVAETRGTFAPALSDDERAALYAQAQSAYARALTFEARWPNANRRLGNLLLNQRGFNSAVPFLETAYVREADYPATIKGLGLAYAWEGRTAEAASVLLNFPNPVAMGDELYTWGNYWRGQQQPLAAAYSFETAQAMFPTVNVDVWLLIGDTYREAKETDSARRWYERVLQIEASNERALRALEEMARGLPSP